MQPLWLITGGTVDDQRQQPPEDWTPSSLVGRIIYFGWGGLILAFVGMIVLSFAWAIVSSAFDLGRTLLASVATPVGVLIVGGVAYLVGRDRASRH